MTDIVFKPIGVIHSPYAAAEGMPIQPYVPEFDAQRQTVISGWLEAAQHDTAGCQSDDRFK